MGGLSLYMHERDVARPQNSAEMNAERTPKGVFSLTLLSLSLRSQIRSRSGQMKQKNPLRSLCA